MTNDIQICFITTQYCHSFFANSDNGNDNSDECVILEEVL